MDTVFEMSQTLNRPVLLAPSILSADFAHLGDEIRAVEKGGADWIHVDVMDGHFVPNITIGIPVVKSLKQVTDLPLDTHLMIADADRYAEEFARAGSQSVSVHVEACPHLHRTLTSIRNAGARAGVVLNPATAAEHILPVLDCVDYVLVMTVNPGFGGQSFIESVLPKISRIRRWITERGLDVDLQVDGGVSAKTIAAARRAGANVFVAGSAVFGSQDYAATLQQLRELAVAEDAAQTDGA